MSLPPTALNSNESIERQYLLHLKSKRPGDLAPVLLALAPMVRSAAHRAGLDAMTADDVVQETFLGLIMSQERYEADRPLIPFVKGIAINQIRMAKRRLALGRELLHGDRIDEEPSHTPAAETRLVRGELKMKVRAAVARLSEANASVLSAAIFDGLSVEAISKKLGISEGAVKVRMHRGMARLKERLGSSGTLAILALTIPRHREVLPGVLARSAKSAAGVSLALVIPLLAVLSCGIWIMQLSWGAESFGEEGARVAKPRALETAALEVAPTSPQLSDADRPAADEAGSVAISFLEESERDLTVLVGRAELLKGGALPRGVEVFVLKTEPSIQLPTSPLIAATFCDADGKFELNQEHLQGDRTPLVYLRAPGLAGYCEVSVEDFESGATPVVKLAPETLFRFTVVDYEGEGIEGARISLLAGLPRLMGERRPAASEFGYVFVDRYHHLFGAVTGPDGVGFVRGVPAMGAKGMIVAYAAVKEGYAREAGLGQLEVGNTETTLVDLVMRRTSDLRLSGSVLGDQGEALAGAEIRFLARGESQVKGGPMATADVNGQWSIPSNLLDDFPIFLSIDRPGYITHEIAILNAHALGPAPRVDRMRRGLDLSGTVESEFGAPVTNASVIVESRFGRRAATTNGDGHFTIGGVTNESKTLLISTSNDEGLKRSHRFKLAANETDFRAVLPDARVVHDVEIVQAEGEDWDRVTLIPMSVPASIQPAAPDSVQGAVAHYGAVLAGEWLAAGVTVSGSSCVKVIEFRPERSPETIELSRSPGPSLAVQIGLGDGPDADRTGSAMLRARRAPLLDLPNWLDSVSSPARSAFGIATACGKSHNFTGLVPGPWQVTASGPGWAVEPTLVEVDAGPSPALLLDPVPAGKLLVRTKAVYRATSVRLDIRRNQAGPWMMAGLNLIGLADGTSVMWIPEGKWLWRLTITGAGDRGYRYPVVPSKTGECSIQLDEPTLIEF